MERLYAVRGAVDLDEDTREQVMDRTQALLKEILGRNQIDPDRIVSIFFTATDDVRSEFPAAAARLMGMAGIPLLCARELDVHSELAVPRCIRVMMHFYGSEPPDAVYLGRTTRLLDPPSPV